MTLGLLWCHTRSFPSALVVDVCEQVKLWYAKIDYHLRLGQLVTIWTPHISNAESNSLIMQHASLVTSIFPERDNSCYFLVQEKSDDGILCKTPLGYKNGKQLDGLFTLKNFMDGGHEAAVGRVLVCIKSIGVRKKCRYTLCQIQKPVTEDAKSQQRKVIQQKKLT